MNRNYSFLYAARDQGNYSSKISVYPIQSFCIARTGPVFQGGEYPEVFAGAVLEIMKSDTQHLFLPWCLY